MRDEREYLQDIIEGCRRVMEYTHGMTREQFFADQRSIDAVVRNIEVIGEASRQMGDEGRAKYPGIPFSAMMGMRNILAHAYHKIDEDILWSVVTVHIPVLKESVESRINFKQAP